MGENAPEEQVLADFPDSKSPNLILTNATEEEKLATWNLNAVNWGTALSKADYLEREAYLTTIPLAKDNGVTHWILVDRKLPRNERPILASCESLRKPVLVFKNGTITEGITHGIGSVFSQPKFRGKGYAARMLRELAHRLKTWQTDSTTICPFSILYSDIGTKYYAKFGWEVHPSTHISFPPSTSPYPSESSSAKPLSYTDIPSLCSLDEQNLRTQLAQESKEDGRTHVALLPSYAQMQWHHLREDFVTSKLFNNKTPSTKGAISSGQPGTRIWAIFSRAFYGPVGKKESGNTLHILRLVVEDERVNEENVERLRGVLEIARREAGEWGLEEVDVWNPSECVRELVRRTRLRHEEVERKEESIASLMWYGDGKGGGKEDVKWVANEKYGWC